MKRAHELELTRFGFHWGPMVVERMFEGPQGHTCVRIASSVKPDQYVDVYVTPKGHKVRAFPSEGAK